MIVGKIFKEAFTLVELLVVIAIVGILSSLIIIGMNSSVQSANMAKVQIFATALRDSLLANLVSEYKFDNISGTVDTALSNGTVIADSWGNNNGTTSGGPTLRGGNNCVYGQCLQFNGGYVNSGNAALNISSQVTVGVWVKFTALDYTGNTGILNAIAVKGSPDTPPGTPSAGFWFIYDNRSNGSSFSYTCFGNASGGYAGGGNNFPYSYVFTNNVWYYLSFTIDSSSNAKLYINGSQYGTTRTFSNLVLANTVNNFYIGTISGGGDYLKGFLDDMRIYNAAMQASKIKEQYYSGMNKLLAKKEVNYSSYLKELFGIL